MKKRFSGNIIKLIISSLFTVIILAISAIILIQLLGPSLLGRFISIYIIPSMLIRLTMLGSRKTAISQLLKNKYSDNEVVSSLLFIWIFSSTMAIAICMINFAVMKHADMTPLTHFFILAAIPLRLFIVYSITVFFGKTKLNFSSLFKLLPDLLNVIIIFFLIYSEKLSINGAIIAYFLSSLLVAIICFIIIIQYFKIKFEFNKKIIKELSSVGLVSALAFFVMQLNYRFDIVLLYKYTSSHDVGIYAIGTAFSFLIWLLPDTIGLIVRKKASHAENFIVLQNEIAGLLRISILSGILSGIILYFVSPFLITLLFGNEYKDSGIILQNILPGIFFFIIFRTLHSLFNYAWKPSLIIAVFTPTLIINILLNIYLIPLYGSIGAAWASNISYTIGAIIILIVFSYKMKISLIKIFSFNIHDFKFLKKLTKIGSREN